MRSITVKRFLAGMIGALAVGTVVAFMLPLVGVTTGGPRGEAAPLALGGLAGAAGWFAGQWVLDLIEARRR